MSYLVAKALRGNDGDLIADTLVGLEVERELWVVPPAHSTISHCSPRFPYRYWARAYSMMTLADFLTVFVRTRPILAVLCGGDCRSLKRRPKMQKFA